MTTKVGMNVKNVKNKRKGNNMKFMTVEDISFKKVDLKRIEWYQGGTFLYIVVAGKKDSICVRCESKDQAETTRANLLAEAGG